MKVFRNIREKSLLSGKVRNYLMYALGEILLIVVGILIAWKIKADKIYKITKQIRTEFTFSVDYTL